MSERALAITSSSEADQADLDAVYQGLKVYNERFAGPAGFERVHLFARDGEGVVRGGLLGRQLWGWLHVEMLWVDEGHRRAGLGSRLLGQAEAEARAAGCTRVFLDTFEFQARPFYEKLGYAVYGVQEDFPTGSRRYYLWKTLPR